MNPGGMCACILAHSSKSSCVPSSKRSQGTRTCHPWLLCISMRWYCIQSLLGDVPDKFELTRQDIITFNNFVPYLFLHWCLSVMFYHIAMFVLHLQRWNTLTSLLSQGTVQMAPEGSLLFTLDDDQDLFLGNFIPNVPGSFQSPTQMFVSVTFPCHQQCWHFSLQTFSLTIIFFRSEVHMHMNAASSLIFHAC